MTKSELLEELKYLADDAQVVFRLDIYNNKEYMEDDNIGFRVFESSAFQFIFHNNKLEIYSIEDFFVQ